MAFSKSSPKVLKGGKMDSERAMNLWRKRKDSLGVDWRSVSAATLKAALAVVIENEAAITISAANGGRGVMLKLWLGGNPVKEYAATAEEVNDLLSDLVETLGSSSEDVQAAMAGGAD